MPDKINKIKNPDFSLGKNVPRNWTWLGDALDNRWHRDADGVHIRCHRRESSGFQQSLNIKPDEYYRIEAVVSPRLASTEGGLVLQLQAQGDEAVRTMPVQTGERLIIRAFWQSRPGQRRLLLKLKTEDATGTAILHEVRVIRVLEPDTESHALALPVPPHALRPVKDVKSITVCTGKEEYDPMLHVLERVWGQDSVTVATPATFKPAECTSDAIILTNEDATKRVRSMKALFTLARDRVVIVSLPVFEKLAPSSVSTRLVQQVDDPIHAKVAYANHATHGFALNDVFPYAWQSRKPGSFAQRQFRKSADTAEYFKKQKLEPLLLSMCDKDSTSDQIIALFREFEEGALYVIDLNPINEPPSTMGEENLSAHLLLSLLGKTSTGLGQFVVPYQASGLFYGAMREMAIRYQNVFTHDEDIPSDELTEQLVTVGREDQGFGIPLSPKPVIIIRSGLAPGDYESIYGSWFWLKQLVRMVPHACPYGDHLASRFRIAWVPAVAPWRTLYGLCPSGRRQEPEMQIDTEDAAIAALIDVAVTPHDSMRVVLPAKEGPYAKYMRYLPSLAEEFMDVGAWSYAGEAGGFLGQRGERKWRPYRPAMTVEVDAGAFSQQTMQDAMHAGGEAVRIEVPGSPLDFIGNSIQRTHNTATLLELVVGLQFGIIAVNRKTLPIRYNGFAPIQPGEALIVEAADLEGRAAAS